MWKTVVRYTMRFAAVPMLPSFSNVSLPITNGIAFHPRYRSSGAAAAAAESDLALPFPTSPSRWASRSPPPPEPETEGGRVMSRRRRHLARGGRDFDWVCG
ncbi:Os07g0190700 [Oryza sativa Japonica Group]|uniref:Os07g0190700 protein n=2 Tax=Oryza sativa subsp. japonica TaxID=39947 RepID=Q0D820_ORYSJ|nr:hypothetical protein EE612_037597 [Oryza sativa]BAF21003.1 Os07g0190700 [Oryza sativa Japonica Group]BAT00418.1 Os07g0190700 [Oryza sativa Japonica Group]|eukprot:NP_001059089.1 Os07g0190700 [Oryza sativa Japonica Group]